ncbi:hypothetical protein ADUPG1_011633, partial [Aduncisulcus paluster]
AKEAADVLFEFFMQYGIPEVIRSDNGSQFVNSIWEHLLKSLHLKHHRIVAGNPQSNGIIERSNRELLKFLRGMIAGGLPSVEWVDALPSVQFLMNTQEHSALGITPFELMFGRETTNLFDILREKQTHDLKLGNRKSKELARRYLDYRKELMDELVEKARKIQEKFKKNEELELVMEGDAVWLVPNKKKKLSARLRGPFIIKNVFPRNMANISSLTDDSTLRVHLRRLVPVKGSHSMEELRSMAASITVNTGIANPGEA